jgi:hypothetical protein
MSVRNLKSIYEKDAVRLGYFVIREPKKRRNRRFKKKRLDLY